MNENEIQKIVDAGFDRTLGEIYGECGIDTGDRSPMQKVTWNILVKEVSALFQQLMIPNMHEQEEN